MCKSAGVDKSPHTAESTAVLQTDRLIGLLTIGWLVGWIDGQFMAIWLFC